MQFAGGTPALDFFSYVLVAVLHNLNSFGPATPTLEMQLTPLRFLAASKHPKNMFETGKLVSVKENGRPIKPLV